MLKFRRRAARFPASDSQLTGGLPQRPDAANETQESSAALRTIAARSSQLGRAAAELDGVLEDVIVSSGEQASEMTRLTADMAEMVQSNRAIAASTQASRLAIEHARGEVARVGDGVRGVVTTLRDVAGAATEITQIALQTRLVAFNATVEAKRAGEAGAGFAVVAEAVKDLAAKVERSSKLIMSTITQLDGRIDELAAALADGPAAARADRRADSTFHAALARVESSVDDIAAASERNIELCRTINDQAGALTSAVSGNGDSLRRVGTNTRRFLEASEELIEVTTGCGVVTDDSPFIDAVLAAAARMSALLEQGVADGRIDLSDLFDEHYRAVAGSNPPQVTTRFVAITDELFAPVQEELLQLDPKVVFCAAVDRNGYLPTHNRKFSRPQGPDPVWNAAHSRNRRIFDDRTGLAAGRNQRRFLLQTYRRDMGGGQRVIMKDLSAPIFVQGRHWGGLRLAYSF